MHYIPHPLLPHCIKNELYLAKWKWILRSGPKLKMLVKFHRSNGSFPNPLNWWWIRYGWTALDKCYWNKENWFAIWKSTMHFSDLHILASTMPLIIEFFYQNKKPIWKILRTDKNNNFKFTIKFLMTLERSYIVYLGFLGIDLFKSVLMYSNGAICLIKILFKMGLFTVRSPFPLPLPLQLHPIL